MGIISVAVAALFDLLKSIMNGLVKFFKEKQKSFHLFLENMKESIKRFIGHISNLVRTGISSMIGTVVSEIFGPIVSLFKKLASFIKQGTSTIIEAIHYLTKKENREKTFSVKVAQVGKIVTAGLAAAGAIVGGELFETVLLKIPVMAVEIPLLGSIASITGMFLASVISGVIGAIIMNQIDRYIEKLEVGENLSKQIGKKNEILNTQDELLSVKEQKYEQTKEDTATSISDRHKQAGKTISEALMTIYRENEEDNDEQLSSIGQDLELLLADD